MLRSSPSGSHCLLRDDYSLKWSRLLQGHLASLSWEYDQPNHSLTGLLYYTDFLLSPILHLLKLTAPADILPSWLKSFPLYIITLFSFFGISFYWFGQAWHIGGPRNQVSGPRLWLQLNIWEVVQTSGKINSKKFPTGLITVLEIEARKLLKAAREKWHILYRRKQFK